MTQVPQQLTTSEAASELGVSTETVRRWCDQGLLECYRLPGRHRRVSAAAVEALIGHGVTPRNTVGVPPRPAAAVA
jgi:excisionase family DNA binding protein